MIGLKVNAPQHVEMERKLTRELELLMQPMEEMSVKVKKQKRWNVVNFQVSKMIKLHYNQNLS